MEINFVFIKKGFQPMIAAAKELALNPDNKNIHSKWQQTNNEVNISFFENFNNLFLDYKVNRCYWKCT